MSGPLWVRLPAHHAVRGSRVWHSVVASNGLGLERFFWQNFRCIPANILPMFFALSGFLVAGSWERTRNLPQFFGYRAIRLVPALTVEVVLSALILGPLVTTLPVIDYFSGDTFRAYFLNILGIPQYHLPGVFESNPYPNAVNVTIWTLPFELECYLMLAILGLVGLRGRGKALLLGAFAIAVVFGTIDLHYSGWQRSGPPGRVLVVAFLAGLLGYLYRDRITLSRRLFWASTVLGLLLSCKASLAMLSLPFVAYCTVWLGMCNPPKKTFLLRGDYSYGLYLFGFPLQQTFAYAFPSHLHWWSDALFGVGAGLLYAAFSWHCIEKPILAKRNEIIAIAAALVRRVVNSKR